MQRNRQRKRNRDASDSEVDRELEAQPEPSQAQQAKQASGAAHWDRHKSNSWHSKKSCTMRALLGSLLFGLMVRRCFPAHIPAEVAIIPNLADRNLFLHLCRGLPPPGEHTRPSEAVEEVLAAYPALRARLRDVPRFSNDINTVDAVGNKLETSFANSLTELFTRRVEQAVALAGATLFAGSFEHRRRLGVPLGGRPAWTQRERSWVSRSVQGKVVTWLQGAGGVVPTGAMREAVAKQRGLLGLREGEVVDEDWLGRKANRGSLLRHAAHHIQLDTRALYGLMRTARVLPAGITSLPKFTDGVVMRDGKPELGLKNSEVANRWRAFLPNIDYLRPNAGQKFENMVHTDGVAVSLMFTRPKPAELPDKLPCMGKEEGAVNPLAHLGADWLGCDPGKTNMATVAHEERHPSGAVESVWQRTLTAGQYYRQSGITQHAKTSKVWMAGIGPQHDALSQVTTYTASLERYQLYVDAVLATWPAMWAEMSKPRWANARFRLYRHKQSTVAKFWAEVSWLDLGLWAVLAICGFERPGETVKGAMVRCNSAETGRPLALAYGAAGFSGSGTIGSKGVPVKQMLREACKHFPGRVVMVHEFRTSRVSSARNDDVQNEAEASRWLYPVRSMAKQSRIRGLMCSTSNVIKRRFYNRDVSAALNIRRIAAGPGRPRELSSWLGRPAMPNPGATGQEWVHVRDKGLLRKWQRRRQRHCAPAACETERNRQRKRNRDASDSEVDRELEDDASSAISKTGSAILRTY
ncbi:hypothetical protein QJQ45_013316 [Haematococcus lacustris]|nr:hypothetical protein QJQ45_013316 [Haematococcus lacustris]